MIRDSTIPVIPQAFFCYVPCNKWHTAQLRQDISSKLASTLLSASLRAYEASKDRSSQDPSILVRISAPFRHLGLFPAKEIVLFFS